MVSQAYVDGITDTVTHHIASPLTAGQIEIAVYEETLSFSVVCPDRWFLGDVAMVTSRDGHAFAGAGGQHGHLHRRDHHQAAGQLSASCPPYAISTARVSAGGALTPSSRITGHRHISL